MKVKEDPELLEKESQWDASIMCHIRKSKDGDAQVKDVTITLYVNVAVCDVVRRSNQPLRQTADRG